MSPPKLTFKKIIASGLGSSFEWYDFTLYSFLAPLLAKNFFSDSYACALLNTFGIFAVGFASRPIGSLIFGYLGDKYGRIKCLQATPLIITIPSIIIALTPSYKNIGFAAPVILLISRIAQGICMGGEYAGTIVYLCETNIKRRYFLGSLGACSTSFGILLASIIAALLYKTLPQQYLLLYGWRIAFLMAIIFGIFTYKMRKPMNETPLYKQIHQSNKISSKPIHETIMHNWKIVLFGIGIIYMHATSFYFTFMFIPIFITKFTGQSSNIALLHNNIFLMSRLLIIPIFGLIAEQYGGKKILRFSCVFTFLSAIFLSSSITSTYTNSTVFIIGALAFFTAINAGVLPGLLVEITLTRTRYTVLSLAFNVSFGIFGGLTPYLSFLLIRHTGYIAMPEYYLASTACVTLIVSFFINNACVNLEESCGKL